MNASLALAARRPFALTVSTRAAGIAGAVVVTLAAAALRLGFAFGSIAPNTFYDAAVRSMGLSWHNFFYGALEPGGTVSIDKAPLDLWLQVASVKLLGFSSTALRLPEAIGGTLAVPLLYALVTRLFGRRAGIVSAAALAVMPVAVVTARSDTMDSLMMALLVAAALLAVRSAQAHRAPLAAGVALGLAFNVKLFEAVVPVPAIALLFLLAASGPLGVRLRRLAAGAAVYAGCALAWVAVASLAPLGARPFPFGSSNGSVWQVVFGYNGIDRLGGGKGATSGGITGLFSAPYGALIGVELLTALVLGVLAVLVARPWLTATRARRAGAAGIGLWLVLGTGLFSAMGSLHPRYLEAMTPAVAGVLGIAVVALADAAARGRRPRPAAIALATAALLALPLSSALAFVRADIADSGRPGYQPPAQTLALSRYLQPRTRGAHYEVAASTPITAGALIVHDARPVMMLTHPFGRQLTPPAVLARAVAGGQLRYALIAKSACRTCVPSVRWALAHGTDVSRRAGLPPGSLYRLSRQPRRGAGTPGTRRTATAVRTARTPTPSG